MFTLRCPQCGVAWTFAVSPTPKDTSLVRLCPRCEKQSA